MIHLKNLKRIKTSRVCVAFRNIGNVLRRRNCQ